MAKLRGEDRENRRALPILSITLTFVCTTATPFNNTVAPDLPVTVVYILGTLSLAVTLDSITFVDVDVRHGRMRVHVVASRFSCSRSVRIRVQKVVGRDRYQIEQETKRREKQHCGQSRASQKGHTSWRDGDGFVGASVAQHDDETTYLCMDQRGLLRLFSPKCYRRPQREKI